MAMPLFNSNNFSVFTPNTYTNSQQVCKTLLPYFHKDGAVHFLQTSTAHEVVSVNSSHLQMIDPISDLLSAPVLYVPVHILTGSVQTDKQHVHKLYSSTTLLTH